MLVKMIQIMALLFGLLVAVSLACNPPQIPREIKSNIANTSNDPTTVGVIGGGQIKVVDCFDVLNIPNTADFNVELSDRKDSTDLADQYYKLFTVGTCELAGTRTDSGRNATS
jgi:hypothetical protein